jgi:hypothetical protein
MADVKTDKLVVTFVKERTTANTIRYAEVPGPDGKYAGLFDDPAIGVQYIKKFAAAALGNPQEFTLTIEPKR